MTRKSNRIVICIVGPTGVGKTETGFKVAKQVGGEIISADSRQMYKYMNIGTDKPPKEYIEQIRHHFVDFLDPEEYYNAGKFGKDAREVIENMFSKNIVPVIVGGSGLYVKSLLEGFFDEEIKDREIKNALMLEIQERGNEALYLELQRIDPVFAEKVAVNDSQRIIRGIEVYRATGKPLSTHWKDSSVDVDFKALVFGLNDSRADLYDRIEKRVDKMLEIGLVDEVKDILSKGFGRGLNSLQTYGYQEVFEYLDESISYDEMIEKIKKRTRNFAKRQITWFKKIKGIRWIDIGEQKEKAVELIISEFRNADIK